MLELVISYLNTVDPVWIYVILFFFAFIENVFPPSPSDVVVIVGASLIGSTTMSFAPVVILTSVASALGFMLMYLVGRYLGEHILRAGRIKFISPEMIRKSDRWFSRYGYGLIITNRFLPGTRSVISFFSGMAELRPARTFLCAAVSAFLWNILIIYFGMTLGNNVALIDRYLSTYRYIILAVTGAVLGIVIIRYLFRKRRKARGLDQRETR